MNKMALKILNSLKIGDNIILVKDLPAKLGISITSINKYIKILHDNGYIEKYIIGLKGGTTNDARKLTKIVRLK
jgi:Mn-dependent DtxR family transcriptional regulator